MKAISVTHSGADYQLILSEHETPTVGKHDVLIRVAASGVNRADLYQAEGNYPAPEGASDVLGLEVSGTIEAIGEEVRSVSVGEEVCALLAGGGYAEYVSVPEWRVLSKPSNLTIEEAAALPEAVFTVYQTLFERAKVSPADKVLIHGGASGIGTTAIQMLKAMNVDVAVTAGSDEKCELCKRLGADVAINYKTHDFVEALKQEWGGVSVVLDMVGGDYIQRNFKVLNKYGRMVQIAFIRGAKVELNAAPILMKNLSIMGSTLRSEAEENLYHMAQSIRTVIWPMIESGAVKPVIDSQFELKEAAKAHDHMREFSHAGKIILTA